MRIELSDILGDYKCAYRYQSMNRVIKSFVAPYVNITISQLPGNCGISILHNFNSNINLPLAIPKEVWPSVYEYVHKAILNPVDFKWRINKLVMTDRVRRAGSGLYIYNICKHNGWKEGPISLNPNHYTYVRMFEWDLTGKEYTEKYVLSKM